MCAVFAFGVRLWCVSYVCARAYVLGVFTTEVVIAHVKLREVLGKVTETLGQSAVELILRKT